MDGADIRNFILKNIKHLENPPYGLRWTPSLEPEISNTVDQWQLPSNIPGEFTEFDHSILTQLFNRMKNPRCIIEVGVDNSPLGFEHSSTNTLLKIKPNDCCYLGIDIVGKGNLDDPEKNIHTLCVDSGNYESIAKKFFDLKVDVVDFAFIDGWHSVNQVLAEWSYWTHYLSNDAIMVFHDTNFHPGPIAVLDAIDTTIFTVELFGRDLLDWGMAAVTKKHTW